MPLTPWLRLLDRIVGTPADDGAQSRGASRREVLGGSVGLLGLVAGACNLAFPDAAAGKATTRPSRPPRRRKREDEAWLNARTMVAFPLARGELPRTGAQLAESMLVGWKPVFALADPAKAVWFEGGRYPAVDKMVVDISGATARVRKPSSSSTKQPELRPPSPGRARSLAVKGFTFQAAPIQQHKAKVHFLVTGTNVRFDLRQDVTGNPLLLLADAEEGKLHFRSTCHDLERLVIAGAKPKAAAKAVNLRDVDIELKSVTPRSLKLDMRVRTLIGGFLPAGLRFRARVDVDDDMNAYIWGLSCDGDEALGPIIVNFIRPAIAKYEGKTKPLLSFPSGAVKLRDLRIRAGETVELAAAFGH